MADSPGSRHTCARRVTGTSVVVGPPASAAMRKVVAAESVRLTPDPAGPFAGSSVPMTGAFPGSEARTSG